MEQNFKRTKLACYTAYFTMSSVFSLPPLLFVTFRELYDISYTLLGTLIMMEEKLPGVGVAAFALMAAGGDLGASVAPQLMGIVIDNVSASGFARELSAVLNLSAEQIGMKAGMLVSAIFPLLGTILVLVIIRYFKKAEKR